MQKLEICRECYVFVHLEELVKTMNDLHSYCFSGAFLIN